MLLLTMLLIGAGPDPAMMPCEALMNARQYRKAEDCFARVAREADEAGDAISIVAHHGRARALLARGSRHRSKRALEVVQARWSIATKDARRDRSIRGAAADAAWQRAEPIWADFQTQRTNAAALVATYEDITAYGHGPTSRRCHTRIAEIWLVLARHEPSGCRRAHAVSRARERLDRVRNDPDTTTTLGRRASAMRTELDTIDVTCGSSG